MATTIQNVPPIARGFAYALQLQITDGDPPFVIGASYRAEIREQAAEGALAGEVSTAAGSIRVVDTRTIEVRMSNVITAKLSKRTAAIDLVRNDVLTEDFVGIGLLIDVVQPVTRPKVAS